jgi:hypothetical protein
MTQADCVYSTPPTSTPVDPTPVAPAIDPVFDLIDAHRKACAAHLAAIQLQNRVEKIRGAGRGNWITEKPCHDENDAFEALVSAAVNTVPGLLAKLVYLQELAENEEWGWVIDDRDGVALHLIESFAASLANISAPAVQA